MRSSTDAIATRILIVISLALVWVFVVSITVPQLWPGNFDYGFFTAVAERLRAGDTLYEEVWDNKDPFVFYSIATARTFGPLGAWLLEISWIVASGFSVFAVARRIGVEQWMAAFVGFAATPIALLGVPYFMGSSHMPGVALTLTATAFVTYRRVIPAGIALTCIAFFKFVMLPLAIAVLLTWLLVMKERRLLPRLGISAAVSTLVITFVLQLRGELLGFLTTQIDNVLYSQSPIVNAAYVGMVQKIGQHVVILINPNVLAIEVSTVVILGLGWLLQRRSRDHDLSSFRALWWTTAIAFLGSVATIAATGKWLHHAEIFAVSSALALIVLVYTLVRFTRWWSIGVVVITLLTAYLLAGRPAPSFYVEHTRDLGSTWNAAQQVDELTAILSPLTPSSVAFVGRGNLLPRSSGLEDWTLACRHMAQRPFNPDTMFTETLECLPRAERIVVTRDYERDAAFPTYVTFVDAVEELLATDYTCKESRGFRVCEQRGSLSSP